MVAAGREGLPCPVVKRLCRLSEHDRVGRCVGLLLRNISNSFTLTYAWTDSERLPRDGERDMGGDGRAGAARCTPL